MRPVLGRVLLAVLGASTVLASQGDRSPAFQRCVATCGRACPAEPPRTWQPVLWSAWSCAADCAYTCTTSLTNLALISPPPATPLSPDELEPAEQNAMRLVGPGGDLEGLELGRMVQFSGKWPFRRYLGTQEILSVIFSLANLWAHAKGWRELGRLDGVASADAATLRVLYRTNALVGINTWVWSAVFHTRDTPWTEKADYFSAAASTLYGLWLAVARSGGLYKCGAGKRRWRRITQAVFGTVFLSHCAYLSRGRFDYGYNMAFNVTVGVAQILLWTTWGLTNFFAQRGAPTPSPTATSHPSTALQPTPRPRHYLRPLQPGWMLLAFTALELLDFAPVPSGLRLLDAHALWHASTIGVVRLWYGFLTADVRWVDGAREDQKLPGVRGDKRRV